MAPRFERKDAGITVFNALKSYKNYCINFAVFMCVSVSASNKLRTIKLNLILNILLTVLGCKAVKSSHTLWVEEI
jgi:uncharacterized ferredoxin-like protein